MKLKKKYKLESDLQKDCVGILDKLGLRYRLHNKAKSIYKQKYLFPDLEIYLGKSKVMFIELKNGKENVDKTDMQFLAWCNKHEYAFFIVSEIEKFKDIFCVLGYLL